MNFSLSVRLFRCYLGFLPGEIYLIVFFVQIHDCIFAVLLNVEYFWEHFCYFVHLLQLLTLGKEKFSLVLGNLSNKI